MAWPHVFGTQYPTVSLSYLDDNFNAISTSTGAAIVGFLQSGTGAVATDLQTRGRQVVFLTDYGGSASASAATNSTALTNSAAALTNGGEIELPAGVVQFNSFTVPYQVPIILRGQGLPDQGTGVPTGTELRSVLRDGVTPAIDCVQSTDDFSLFAMENLYLSGGTYAEVTGGPGQGGSPLGNFVGLSMKNRPRWRLTSVRIAGFDTDNFRLDTGCYYGAAYSSAFMWGGTGVNSIDGGNVEGFYNCHFQYNVYGTVNVRNTFGCAWEGQWKSGQKYNILGIEGRHYVPYFEANNGSDTSGEGDIWADTTNYPAAIHLDSPHFASGGTYSAKANPTYLFNGKVPQLTLSGAMRIAYATPQLYALFNLVGASNLLDLTLHTSYFNNYASFTAMSGQVIKGPGHYSDAVVAGGATALQHYGYDTLRITASGAVNLDNIASGYFGQRLRLLFGDTNVTVRHAGGGTGNIRLDAASYVPSASDATMELAYDPNGDLWKMISWASNS